MSLPEVDSCAVGLSQGSRLVAFVVASRSVHQGELSRSVQQGEPEGSVPEDRALRRSLLQQLSLLVPGSSVPDSLVLVRALPLTAHGRSQRQRTRLCFTCLIPPYVTFLFMFSVWLKRCCSSGKVDLSALMELYRRQRERSESDSSFENLAELKHRLTCLWQVWTVYYIYTNI